MTDRDLQKFADKKPLTSKLRWAMILQYVCIKRPCPILMKHLSLTGEEVYELANIKSAKKRVLVNKRNYDRNKSIKSSVKTAIKKVEAAVAAGDKEAAQAALLAATSTIDKAATKGVYHKNNASRKVSRLAKLVNSME